MGKERAIIFLGTAIASLFVVLGMVTVFPTIDQIQTQSTGLTVNAHYTLTIADAQGNVLHYIQMDNYATDDFKDDIAGCIADGCTLPAFDFVGGCKTTAATAFSAQACASAELASLRCDSADATAPFPNGSVTSDPANSPGDLTTADPSEFGKICDILIVAADDNSVLTDLFIASAATGDNIANFATLGTAVTIFETQILTVTVDFDIN